MSTIMRAYSAHFTGAYVARCPRCGIVCAYWDDDDLDENGNLLCHCDAEEEAEHADVGACCECGADTHTCQDCPTFGGPGITERKV